jgi:hypothetical protein
MRGGNGTLGRYGPSDETVPPSSGVRDMPCTYVILQSAFRDIMSQPSSKNNLDKSNAKPAVIDLSNAAILQAMDE